jgi:lipopolysaccharide export system permease protein
MKVLTRYVAREFLKMLFICFAAVTMIYLLAHFLGKLDDFIKYRASLTLIGTLLLLRIPRVFYEVIPIVVLLATLITLALLARNHEITAMRSCGVALRRLVIPFFVVTIILAALALVTGEWAVPYANQKASYLTDTALKKRTPILALEKNRIWFRTGKDSFCNIQKVDPDKKVLYHVTLYTFNQSFELVNRLDADQLSWDGRQWVTSNGTQWTFTLSGEIKQERTFKGPFPLQEPLEEIIDVEKSSREMGYAELRDYIKILKHDGYPTAAYEVDLHAKISYGVITLIMVLIGIPSALFASRRGGVATSIGISLVIGFLYWLGFSVGLSFGNAGLLPPLGAAWVANILFGVSALVWTMKIRF